MASFKKKGLYKKRTAMRKKRVVKRSGRPTKSFTKMVQSVISRNIENKSYQASYQMDLFTPIPTGGDFVYRGLFPLTPYDGTGVPIGASVDINQGTGQSSRIGNVIRTKRATLKGVMFPNPVSPGNPSPKAVEVVMWIFKMKQVNGGGLLIDANDVATSRFFQDNNGATGLTGDLINIIQTPNQDTVNVLHKRVFKLGYSSGSASGNLANNDFKYNQKFSINVTKYLPKVIKYDDNDIDPSIRHTYCLVVPFYADGTVGEQQFNVADCHWEIDYTYEDA